MLTRREGSSPFRRTTAFRFKSIDFDSLVDQFLLGKVSAGSTLLMGAALTFSFWEGLMSSGDVFTRMPGEVL